MRTITDHKVGGLNEGLEIVVVDEPGQGNACHEYRIHDNDGLNTPLGKVSFQNGPIKENGVNGITQEVLLAIVIDRLRGFQSGDFACRDNAIALTHCEDALMRLQKRTRDRLARGVEGTNKK